VTAFRHATNSNQATARPRLTSRSRLSGAQCLDHRLVAADSRGHIPFVGFRPVYGGRVVAGSEGQPRSPRFRLDLVMYLGIPRAIDSMH
jgi:hypothetical protein